MLHSTQNDETFVSTVEYFGRDLSFLVKGIKWREKYERYEHTVTLQNVLAGYYVGPTRNLLLTCKPLLLAPMADKVISILYLYSAPSILEFFNL